MQKFHSFYSISIAYILFIHFEIGHQHFTRRDLMATKNEESVSFFDKIWLQFGIATAVTVVWLLWIFYEIILKNAPEG
ncbi:MAG: hypothetical protein ACXAC2_15990 [Candidatus Kariarchaeaceae archaeon]